MKGLEYVETSQRAICESVAIKRIISISFTLYLFFELTILHIIHFMFVLTCFTLTALLLFGSKINIYQALCTLNIKM